MATVAPSRDAGTEVTASVAATAQSMWPRKPCTTVPGTASTAETARLAARAGLMRKWATAR